MSDRDVEVRIVGDLRNLEAAMSQASEKFTAAVNNMSDVFRSFAATVRDEAKSIEKTIEGMTAAIVKASSLQEAELSKIGQLSNKSNASGSGNGDTEQAAAASKYVVSASQMMARSLDQASAAMAALAAASKYVVSASQMVARSLDQASVAMVALAAASRYVVSASQMVASSLDQASVAMAAEYAQSIALAKSQGLLSSAYSNVKKSIAAMPAQLSSAYSAMQRFSQAVSSIFASLAAFYLLFNVLKDIMGTFSKAQSAMMGLATVSSYAGTTFEQASASASRLASDGLMTIMDTSLALQNLLSKGYNLDEAEKLIFRLKDAAAFNRQASFAMSEAVVRTTEGIKMEMSVVSDAAGVQKNLDDMKIEYARTLGKTVTALSAAENRQAIYNGFMKESEVFTGNSAKMQGTFAGKMSQTDVAITKLKISMGEAFSAPVSAGMTSIVGITENLSVMFDLLSLAVGYVGLGLHKLGIELAYIAYYMTTFDSSIFYKMEKELNGLSEKYDKFKDFKLKNLGKGIPYIDDSPDGKKKKEEETFVDYEAVKKENKLIEAERSSFYKNEIDALEKHLTELENLTKNGKLSKKDEQEFNIDIKSTRRALADAIVEEQKRKKDIIVSMENEEANSIIDIEKIKNQKLYDTGKISEERLLELNNISLDKRFNAEVSALQARMNNIIGDGDRQRKERDQLNSEMQQLILKHNSDVLSADNDLSSKLFNNAKKLNKEKIKAYAEYASDLNDLDKQMAQFQYDTGKISFARLGELMAEFSNKAYDIKIQEKRDLLKAEEGGPNDPASVLAINNEILDLERDKSKAAIDIANDTAKKMIGIEQDLASKRAAFADIVGKGTIDSERQGIKELSDTRAISVEQRINMEKDLERRSLALTLAGIDAQEKLDRDKKGASFSNADEQGFINSRESAQISSNLRIRQANLELTMEMTKDWSEFSGSIRGAFTDGLSSLMYGMSSFKEVFNTFMTTISKAFTDMVAKRVVSWAIGENSMTAATLANSAIRVATETAAIMKVVALNIWAALKSIAAFAWQAAAAVYSSIAAIPFVGPFMAPAVAAGAAAVIIGYGANLSAAGGYDIPSGVNPVVQAHQKEMILPEKYADVIRGISGAGGSGGGNTVNLTIKALDSKDVIKALKGNGALPRTLRDMGMNSTFKTYGI